MLGWIVALGCAGGAGTTGATPGSVASAPTAGTSNPSTGLPLDGFGTLTGDCGVLTDGLLADDAPHAFFNALDLGDGDWGPEDLSEGAQRILEAGNLGGSSLESEAFAYDVEHRCELAELLKTEAEIDYVGEGSRADFLVSVRGTPIGVSVTRAVGWPQDDPYTLEQAEELLADKLDGLLEAAALVADQDAWARGLLHVLAYGPEHADRFAEAWDAADPALRADTILVVTVTDGEDGFLY